MPATGSLIRIAPRKFIWGGVACAVAFWFLDSLIDITFFSQDTYLESLQPSGVELYMRILVMLQIVGFAILTAKYVEANNRINTYRELKLQEDYRRYRVLAENAPIGIITLSPDFLIIDWNRGATEIFGWPETETIGQNFLLFLFPEGTWPEAVNVMTLIEKPRPAIAPSRTKDGNIIPCEWRYAPIHDNSGRMVSIMAIGLPRPAASPE